MSVPKPRYAYVTLVMCGDEYVQAASVLAWSLRKQKTGHELVAITTPDVGSQARKALCKLYDRVIKVNYVKCSVRSTLRGKKYRSEDKWLRFSLTKARMLKLTEYDKVLWMDADMIALANIDHLFSISAPAGICSSVRDHSSWHETRLPQLEVESAIQNNYGIYGCLMLLRPSLEHYFLACSQPEIGDETTFMGPDEDFFTKLFQTQWTHIHTKYGCTRWYAEKLNIKPDVIHFAGEKPWEDKESEAIEEWAGLYHYRNAISELTTVFPQLKNA